MGLKFLSTDRPVAEVSLLTVVSKTLEEVVSPVQGCHTVVYVQSRVVSLLKSLKTVTQ